MPQRPVQAAVVQHENKQVHPHTRDGSSMPYCSESSAEVQACAVLTPMHDGSQPGFSLHVYIEGSVLLW